MPKDNDTLETTDDDDDVYDEDQVEDELDNDEIDNKEAGMLEGFDRDGDKSFDGKKKKKK